MIFSSSNSLLDDDGDVVAELGGIEDGLDILGVLVAVADDRDAVDGGKWRGR